MNGATPDGRGRIGLFAPVFFEFRGWFENRWVDSDYFEFGTTGATVDDLSDFDIVVQGDLSPTLWTFYVCHVRTQLFPTYILKHIELVRKFTKNGVATTGELAGVDGSAKFSAEFHVGVLPPQGGRRSRTNCWLDIGLDLRGQQFLGGVQALASPYQFVAIDGQPLACARDGCLDSFGSRPAL